MSADDLAYDAIHWGIDADGDFYPLPDPLSITMPVVTDVRSGVVYGIEGATLTGTLDVSGGGPVLPTSTESERWFSTMVSIRGASITYVRGATSATITCIPMGAELSSDEYSGTVRRADAKDFVILSSAFGSFVLPERGDQITHAGITYRVGEPPYRQMSVDAKVIRIFAERI